MLLRRIFFVTLSFSLAVFFLPSSSLFASATISEDQSNPPRTIGDYAERERKTYIDFDVFYGAAGELIPTPDGKQTEKSGLSETVDSGGMAEETVSTAQAVSPKDVNTNVSPGNIIQGAIETTKSGSPAELMPLDVPSFVAETYKTATAVLTAEIDVPINSEIIAGGAGEILDEAALDDIAVISTDVLNLNSNVSHHIHPLDASGLDIAGQGLGVVNTTAAAANSTVGLGAQLTAITLGAFKGIGLSDPVGRSTLPLNFNPVSQGNLK